MNWETGAIIGAGVLVFNVVSSLLADKWQGVQLGKEIEGLKDINKKQWDHIDGLSKWDISHEKEDLGRHLILELKIAGLDGNVGKLNEKLDSIENKLDDLIDSLKNKN